MKVKDELIKNTKNKSVLEKDSIQYNSQQLEQEQNVDINPIQLNSQNLHIHVCNDKPNYAGKITGIAYLEKNKKVAKNVDILLFFGNDYNMSVYKTKSDCNGNFIIEDLPSGYYTLVAEYNNKLKYHSHYIKVFAGHTAHECVLLK